jgi:hypothetical protein
MCSNNIKTITRLKCLLSYLLWTKKDKWVHLESKGHYENANLFHSMVILNGSL